MISYFVQDLAEPERWYHGLANSDVVLPGILYSRSFVLSSMKVAR